MLDIEIFGNADAVSAARHCIGTLAQSQPRDFIHRGIAGEAAVTGILATILPHALPSLLDLLKPLVSRDRDLKLSVNGFELQVRDMPELSAVLDMLETRGIVPKA
jgi:hypothetical protein